MPGKRLAMSFYTLCKKLKIDKNDANIYILDKECSSHVRDTIHGFNVSYQLAPSYQHSLNTVENAVKTFKVV